MDVGNLLDIVRKTHFRVANNLEKTEEMKSPAIRKNRSRERTQMTVKTKNKTKIVVKKKKL